METVERARSLWSRMTDCEDPAPLGHDGYLKFWSLGNPELPFDFIMLDEAQDTNPVALSVLRKQACQMVYVGDRHQQIYEWRGAINAMEEIETDSVSELTLSFRFGRAIAEAASRVLSRLGEHHPLRGNDEIQSVLNGVNYYCRSTPTTSAAVVDSPELQGEGVSTGGVLHFRLLFLLARRPWAAGRFASAWASAVR